MFSVWEGGWFAGGFWVVGFVLFGWCAIVCFPRACGFRVRWVLLRFGVWRGGFCRLRGRLLVVLWLLL